MSILGHGKIAPKRAQKHGQYFGFLEAGNKKKFYIFFSLFNQFGPELQFQQNLFFCFSAEIWGRLTCGHHFCLFVSFLGGDSKKFNVLVDQLVGCQKAFNVFFLKKLLVGNKKKFDLFFFVFLASSGCFAKTCVNPL